MARRQLAGLVITMVGLASIAVATLTPVHGITERSPWWCVTCGSLVVADAIVNVALFVPAGIGLALLTRRTVGSVVLLALISVVVEILQAFVIAGRDTALRDVLANAVGAAVGVEVVHRWRLWLVPAPALARFLALAAAAGWIAALGMTVTLSHPSAPLRTYFGQRGTVPEFTGQVVRVAVNDSVVPLGVLEPWPVVAAFNADDPRVDVAFIPGVPSGTFEPIARVSNPQIEVFRLSQRGHDLVFSIRTRSADVGLRSPIVRLAGGVPVVVVANGERRTDTVSVRGRLRRGVLSLEAQGATRTGALRITPATGWVYFAPAGITTRVSSWLIDGLWVAALLLPVGYWTAAGLRVAGQRRRALATTRWLWLLIGMGLVAPLVLVAKLTGAPEPAWSTWVFALASLSSGALALRMVRAGVRNPGS